MSMLVALSLALDRSGSARPLTGPDIVVTAPSDGFDLPLKSLQAADRVFHEASGSFAPRATLYFQLRGRDGLVDRHARLWLANGEQRQPIVTDPAGRFVLPALPTGRWRVRADRPAASVTLRPVVRSPGAEAPSLRLGDLRLQCRVAIAMMASEAPLLAQPLVGMFRAAGPCTSHRIGLYEQLDHPVRSARLVEGGREQAVQVTPGGAYRNPGFERGFSNDARLVVD